MVIKRTEIGRQNKSLESEIEKFLKKQHKNGCRGRNSKNNKWRENDIGKFQKMGR